MRQILNRLLPTFELLINREVNQTLSVGGCSTFQKRYGHFYDSKKGGPPIERQKNKEWSHSWYKWNYERLPTQTSLDVQNPQFAIRAPEFKLPKRRTGLTRKNWRRRVAEVSDARQNPTLEKLARNRQLMISVDDVEQDWQEEYGFDDINNLSRFYGINRDLFNNKDVNIETWLGISFGNTNIHRGNIVSPTELLFPPTILNYQGIEDHFTTLVLSNLDGHPLDSSKEILHWVVANIPDDDVSQGDTIVEYLPPTPWKGTGFHRFVFTLYKHESTFNYSNIVDTNTLGSRTLSSCDISSTLDMTPVGLAWCQSEWDSSVANTCSYLVDISGEPIFDFEDYIEPKEEFKQLKIQASELKFRNM